MPTKERKTGAWSARCGRVLCGSVLCALVMILVYPAAAQVGVRLYGKITDGAGKPIEGAAVELTVWEEGSKQTVHVETDTKGRYRAVMMHNSRAYRFVITKEGFQTLDHIEEPGLKRSGLNAPINKDFQLSPGTDAPPLGGSSQEVSLAGRGAEAYNLGVQALQDGDLENARQAFQEAVQGAPEFALGHAALASVLFDLEEFEDAVEQAKKAIALGGDVGSLDLLYRAGREIEDDEAITQALKGLATRRPDKTTARMFYNEGVTAYDAALYDRATEHFRSAQQLDPALLPAGRALARTYLKQGNFAEAKAEAERLVEMDQYDLEALDVLQRAREALEDTKE